MKTETMALTLPVAVYDQLQSLAAEQGTDPADVVAQLVAAAAQQRAWRHNLAELREQIRRDGGLHVGATKDEVVQRLRQTRREIFAAEYAHLYR
jgi:16S rRNA G1207 methylase RsmC